MWNLYARTVWKFSWNVDSIILKWDFSWESQFQRDMNTHCSSIFNSVVQMNHPSWWNWDTFNWWPSKNTFFFNILKIWIIRKFNFLKKLAIWKCIFTDFNNMFRNFHVCNCSSKECISINCLQFRIITKFNLIKLCTFIKSSFTYLCDFWRNIDVLENASFSINWSFESSKNSIFSSCEHSEKAPFLICVTFDGTVKLVIN